MAPPDVPWTAGNLPLDSKPSDDLAHPVRGVDEYHIHLFRKHRFPELALLGPIEDGLDVLWFDGKNDVHLHPSKFDIQREDRPVYLCFVG